MELRPTPARWFEFVVSKADADDALEALARNGGVQFEWIGEEAAAQTLKPLQEAATRYRALAVEFARYWPPSVFEQRCCKLPVDVAAEAAIGQLERWRTAAEPLLACIERIDRERRDLESWRPVLAALADGDLDLSALANAGPVLAGYCLILPMDHRGGSPPVGVGGRRQASLRDPDRVSPIDRTDGPRGSVAGPPHIDLIGDGDRERATGTPGDGSLCSGSRPEGLHAEVRFDDRRARLGIASRDLVERLRDANLARGGTSLALPAWFPSSPSACRAALSERLADLEREATALQQKLIGLAEALGVDQACGVLERIEWFSKMARSIHCEGQLCLISGWTDAPDPKRMNHALRHVGVDAEVAFGPAPRDAVSPSVMRNPRWMEPFEVFTRAVGVPGLREADPTTWVALMVPLLFGYMCGDVGHGAVIIAAGLLIRRRTRLWMLLTFCGFAAMGFGFVYGDVFGYEHLITPLWVRPLEQPLDVLFVPVVGGAVILTLGVLLHTVQTCWRGEASSRGVTDIAHLFVYWGLLLTWIDVRTGWLSVFGMLLCLSNRLWTGGAGLSILAGFGQLVQSIFEMLISTLSFARVGAFALAHAALESAVLGVAGGVDSIVGAALIVVVGNLMVIVIEGMVVSIQTTRLIVFEFFARFFEGTGRRFNPAPLPPAAKDD